VVLGHEVTGLMTNDVEWGEEVKHAARIAGERVREVPLFPEYEEYVKGETDDLINHAAEVVPAGIFLKHFAEGIPWVHLDIERTARASSEKGLFVKGPTGAGVRTLIQLALLYGWCPGAGFAEKEQQLWRGIPAPFSLRGLHEEE
jgi:leucyl aminopeptidase